MNSESILIDTNVLIRFLGGCEPFADTIKSAETVYIHPVVYGEFMNGISPETSAGMAIRRQLEAFLDAPSVEGLTVSLSTSVHYTKIYRCLKSKGSMIPQNDIWIAASALEHGYGLLTHDAHFSGIPMLDLLCARADG